ncbi:MAG: ornithine aminotransferase [Anaerolineae bacterium]|nr:MAG: ornithine aminotransferase [Anaerolineae bacterium]
MPEVSPIKAAKFQEESIQVENEPLTSEDYINLADSYGAHTYRPLDVVISRGEGVWLYDVDGGKYLDCLSAYSAVNQGHCNPKIMRAAVDQMGQLTLTSRAFRNDQMGPFLKDLCELTGYDLALPMNTGAEAVETAIKAARKWGYITKGVPKDQAEIIVCEGNFHGRTTTIIGFSSEESYKTDFGPFTPGFRLIPYGDIKSLEAAITSNTVAFLFEPIQGESGVIIPGDGYLRAAANLCKEHNILLVADEIQTGLGRTGRLFGCDHEDVRPDVMIVGKALSGGFYPVSAVLSDHEVLGLFKPGDHGSTFGGNPLGAAVARAALKVIVEDDLVNRSRQLGEYFKGKLERIESSHIKEVRGKGLFIGVELFVKARPFAEELMARGILVKETHDYVLRFAPPLIITKDEIDWAVNHIESVLMAD